MRLDHIDRLILFALDETAASVTADVAREIGGPANRHRRSQQALVRLRELERAGLVKRLDAQTPICWQRTAAGTNAINGVA